MELLLLALAPGCVKRYANRQRHGRPTSRFYGRPEQYFSPVSSRGSVQAYCGRPSAGRHAAAYCYEPAAAQYTPAQPGSWFWGFVGTTVGGLAGTAIGGIGGPISAFFASTAGGTFLGELWGSGTDMYFNFWNSNAGQWQSVDISPDSTESAMLSTDQQGYSVTGDYDSSSNTVTITIVPN